MTNQKVDRNSKAIQAGRDVNIGLSYNDVKEIVYDLFKQNFPKLVEEAKNCAKENIDTYVEKLEENLKLKIELINLNKFREPNTQYLLNKSIEFAARKGNSIDLDLLSEALISTIRKNNTEMLNIVAEQALDVIPKLTSRQINIITIIQFILYMNLSGLNDYAQAESNNQKILHVTKQIDNEETLNMQYMSSLGVATFNQFQGTDPYEAIKRQYDYLFKNKSTSEVKQIIEEKSPSMKIMADKYKELNLRYLSLTPVGCLIALINLRRVFTQIDYSIWIK